MHADLFAREGGFTPRPAWQVIEAARRQMLTGELSLATTPTTHVYLRDGQVYFAERTTDGGLGVRLLVEGVITRQQMGKGALLVSGVEHLGRMFQRDPSIDRQSVELCVELMTDDVLTSVADDVIEHYKMTMYKRHPNGIDRWLPNRIEVITHLVADSALAEPDAVIAAGPGPRSRHTVASEPPPAEVADAEVVRVEEVDSAALKVDEIQVQTVVVEEVVVEEVVVQTVVVEEVVVEEVVVQTVVVEDAVVEEVVVEDAVVEEVVVEEGQLEAVPMDAGPAQAITEEIAIVDADPFDAISAALALAATYAEVPTAEVPVAGTQPYPYEEQLAVDVAEFSNESVSSFEMSAVDAIMTSSIADEVAEAVRRALSAIDAAARPMPHITPADFADPAPASA